MDAVLLQAKLYVPKPRAGLVPRPRLRELLDRGTETKLLLVSAPAGFGKTTLLAEWLAAAGRPAAWLSLDGGDAGPAVFWTYVISALRTVAPGAGESALAVLDAPQPQVRTALAMLLNDLDSGAGDIILVLDDYHVIENPEVTAALEFFLDHLPPRLHVVIASRADPALRLPRMRARGDLTEIRAADLRFTAGEAAAYLARMTGLSLAARDVTRLAERTEGWIAGLQLAALSLRGRTDAAAFIDGFAGDDRHVLDYLAEEVLRGQPGPARDFLLRTSVLDRLTGPLCDAVTGRDGGKATLEALDRANLFLVPLDDRREWYRYHHLFADVLRAHLADEHPGELPDLHRRASAWHEANGDRPAAIGHALAGGDFGQAARLAELAIPDLRRNRQEAALRGWLEAVPEDVIRARPVLCATYGGALLASGELDGVEERLRTAERWLASPGPGMIVADETEFARLPGYVELWRAAQSLATGQPSGAVGHAQRALDLAPEDDHFTRAGASGLLGIVAWAGGNLDEAHRAWTECMTGLRRSGHVTDVFGCAIALADIRIAQGRLGDALRTYEQALRLAPEGPGPALRGVADMHVGISEVRLEQGDPEAAARHLRISQELGEHTGLPQHPYRRRVALALLRQAEGDLPGALDLVEEAERLYVADFFPNVRPVSAIRARLLLAQGKVGEALGWARDQGLSADDELSYQREFEHITLARVLLAQGSGDSVAAAARLLDRLARAAEDGGRAGRLTEIRQLRALADADAPGQRGQALADPLSDRELDVLRLLGTDLTGPEIARHLMVSLNTVRTHTKHIYAKLAVTSRRAAVRRGAELGL